MRCSMLDAVRMMDCDIERVVSALESGVLHLIGNFAGDEDAVARQARVDDDPPVFDGSMWAAFGE